MRLKPILFSLSVLIMSFLVGYFIFAWQEPSLSPPEGNVPTPINVGIEPQAKAGRISATEFGDSNNPSYFLNPEGNSLFGGMTETNTLRLTPRTQPTTPQEGQFYWDSELHAFCYYNGSEWICLEEAPPEGVCANWPTQTDDPDCEDIDCSGWYVQTGDEGPTQIEYCYNKQDITTDRCKDVGQCKEANTSDCDAQTNDTQQYSCGTCCYISSASCTGTTKGSCSYYAAGTDTGTCRECDGAGGERAPSDDSACGTISCDDWHHIVGSPSATGINYCYDSPDITINRCKGLGDCKDANTADCGSADDTNELSCGLCKYVNGCSGITDGYCSNYGSGTSCGTCKQCSDGSCNSVTTGWGSGGSGCSGSNQRCYGGSCRTCGGVFTAGAGATLCWYQGSGAVIDDCADVCSSHGGNYYADCHENDDTSCSVAEHFTYFHTACNTCEAKGTAEAPRILDFPAPDIKRCWYRTGSGNCNSPSLSKAYQPLCACNY